ncbi:MULTISPECIES: hypothetical protein [unclassified Thioalkalivibrio]|uniref:hypothetical protein n=1 Tax=unclassified Thioalkalivibrio TaxID=2621013 RepID=UPI0012DCDD8D|nr:MULTISPECIES: hypothetical protein [unclassified Thioalkalivibrio]
MDPIVEQGNESLPPPGSTARFAGGMILGATSTLAIALTSTVPDTHPASFYFGEEQNMGIHAEGLDPSSMMTWTPSSFRFNQHEEFAAAVAHAVEALSPRQNEVDTEALGILFDNAWDLYETS